eukprot:TRINITY_DN56639_c0_g1_i1.p1 TRINITY_DN56639_c0_g1~~TRINITY_DN56639_c0_g1_i1.p1  ORF type:complete len:123 (-),score=24.46 TRINITY_DN56639_c0_g1_i1:66-434(-)
MTCSEPPGTAVALLAEEQDFECAMAFQDLFGSGSPPFEFLCSASPPMDPDHDDATRMRGWSLLDEELVNLGDDHQKLLQEVLGDDPVSYTHLRAHETPEHLVCRLLLEKKKIVEGASKAKTD